MFDRQLFEICFSGSKSVDSSGWVPGHESAWQSSPLGSGNSISRGHRSSSVSDSCDTGIGTYCSDSVEGRMSWLFILHCLSFCQGVTSRTVVKLKQGPLTHLFKPLCLYNVSSMQMDNDKLLSVLPSARAPHCFAIKNLAHFRAVSINFRLYICIFVCPHPQTQIVELPDGCRTKL